MSSKKSKDGEEKVKSKSKKQEIVEEEEPKKRRVKRSTTESAKTMKVSSLVAPEAKDDSAAEPKSSRSRTKSSADMLVEDKLIDPESASLACSVRFSPPLSRFYLTFTPWISSLPQFLLRASPKDDTGHV